ncbi:MAG: LysM peptidoglycan-binding domain-containing protein [Anaerolineales bacterium]
MTDTSEAKRTKASICATCGSKLKPGDTRCSVCGATVRDRPSSVRGSGSSQISLSLPVALIILAVFTVLAVGLTYLATRGLGGGAEQAAEATITLTPTDTATLQPTPTDTPVYTPTPLPTLEYIVDTGDTLLAIAVRYDVSIQSILQINPGLNSQSILSVGQRLNLPQPTPTPSPEPSVTLPPEEATRAACDTVVYTVEADDTLGGIADNYNVNPLAIMDFNGKSSDTVFLGEILLIPLCERNPTPGPSPTPTPPPPYPAPNLLLPQDGAPFSLADDTITLQWAAVGQLRDNEYYQVTVEDVTEGSGARRLVDYVKDTKYIIPLTFRPNSSTPHVMRWWVQPVRQVGITPDGDPRYETGGALSLKRTFTWSGAVPGETPTP